MITIYVNLRCSKCKIALNLLKESGKEFEIVEYLKTGLNTKLISKFFDAIGVEIIRKKDLNQPIFMNKENIVNAIVKNPLLLQRPVLVDDSRIILGRNEQVIKNFLNIK